VALIAVALLAALAALPGCYALYLIHLGIGQARILLARRDVTQVLRDPSVSEKEKSLIRLALEARRYGEEEVGLRRTDNFGTYVRLDRKVVSWVVSGAQKTRLEPYRWWFPIVGSVPYKGYFAKPRAQKEVRRLAGQGYDTYVGGVADYSTLGYFADPIFSTFLRYPEVEIPELILHELTHATLFVRGEVDFDEGLATFVGNRAGVAFLERRFGPGDARVREARARIDDDMAFGAFIERVSRRLEALYDRGLPERETLARRDGIFLEEKRAFEEVRKGFSTPLYDNFGREEWNNAVILAHRRYYGDLPAFERLYESKGKDLRRVVAFFLDAQARGENPKDALRRATGTAAAGRRAEAG